MDENATTTAVPVEPAVDFVTRRIQFGSILSLQIPSTLCSLFIFYYLIFPPRRHPNRRVNVILLCSLLNDFVLTSTELTLGQVLLYQGTVIWTNRTFCLVWAWIGLAISVTSVVFLALMSIERYLLVFHEYFFKRHILLCRYLPLAFCLVYVAVFYTYTVFFFSCDEPFDYQTWGCSSYCYIYDPFLGPYDSFVNFTMPGVVVIFMSSLLLGRIIYHKCLLKQAEIIGRNKKLILHLTLYTVVYLTTWFPLGVTGTLLAFMPTNELVNYLYKFIFAYTWYLTPMCTPFLALITLPDIYQKLRQICRRQKVAAVGAFGVTQRATHR